MLLPFIAWSLTALYFIVRQSNGDAYERPEVRHYAMRRAVAIPAQSGWEELRYFRTALGEHLLVRQDGAWKNLDPTRLKEAPWPGDAQVRLLVEEAIGANPGRYGDIQEVDGRRIRTSTGVDIEFDWNTMSLTQRGRDTRWIDRLYSIHYLEWTGIAALDRLLGVAGLCLLIYMTWSGALLAFGLQRRSPPRGSGGN